MLKFAYSDRIIIVCMLFIFLFVLGLASACLLASYLLKRFITDGKKRKIWSIVTYALLALIAIVAFISFLNQAKEQNALYESYLNENPYNTNSRQDSNASVVNSNGTGDLRETVILKGETDGEAFTAELRLSPKSEQVYCEFSLGIDTGVVMEEGGILCSIERIGDTLIAISGEEAGNTIRILPFEKDFSDNHITAKLMVGQTAYMLTLKKSNEEDALFY